VYTQYEAKLQLIDPALASGKKHGYQFEVELLGQRAYEFDLTAKPTAGVPSPILQPFFYSNETMIVFRTLIQRWCEPLGRIECR